MTDLTEKWKKGKLKEGAYYVRNEHDAIFTAENYINYDCFNDTKAYDFYNVETTIVEVLAPVPSYEEWEVKNERIEKLEELLKEWVQFEIEENPIDFTVMSERMSGLASKTKEVLK